MENEEEKKYIERKGHLLLRNEDLQELTEVLDPEQRAEVLNALIEAWLHDTKPEFNDRVLSIIYRRLHRGAFEHENKYKKKCDQNKANRQKREEKRRERDRTIGAIKTDTTMTDSTKLSQLLEVVEDYTKEDSEDNEATY